jgi:hypothetical protein
MITLTPQEKIFQEDRHSSWESCFKISLSSPLPIFIKDNQAKVLTGRTRQVHADEAAPPRESHTSTARIALRLSPPIPGLDRVLGASLLLG